MNSKNRESPILCNEDQIDEVLELGKATIEKNIIEPIESTIEKLRKTISELQLLPGVDRVIFRIDTINYLFENIRKVLGDKRYRTIQKENGKLIGTSFAEDFINFLHDNGRLPKNENVLIKIWARIESNANWGQFTALHDENNNIIITVKNSFLTRGLLSQKHSNCDFMKGYLFGLLWEVIKEYYIWFSREITKPAAPMLEPFEIIEEEKEDICSFTINRRENILKKAFESIENARFSYKEGNLAQSISYLRSCIEFCFKEKIGIPIDSRLSYAKLSKAFKKNNVKFKSQDIDKIFAKTSRIIHSIRSPKRIETIDMIRKVNKLIMDISLVNISKRNIELIKKELELA